MRRTKLLALVLGVVPTTLAMAADPTDWERFQGTWQLVCAESNGEKAPEERVRQIRVIIRGSSHSVMFGDQKVVENVKFELDPSTTPSSTTDTLDDGRKVRGIYKIEGDRLTSCVAAIDAERPTDFTAPAGSGRTLRVFRRVPDPKAAP